MEYTKGEWKVTENGEWVMGIDGFAIAKVSTINVANAHLIAAAPDMYEALKAIADSSSPISPKTAHEMADKALAKAEGKVKCK